MNIFFAKQNQSKFNTEIQIQIYIIIKGNKKGFTTKIQTMIRQSSANSGRQKAVMQSSGGKGNQQYSQQLLGYSAAQLQQHQSDGTRHLGGQHANAAMPSNMTTITSNNASNPDTISDFKSQHLRGSRSPYGRGEAQRSGSRHHLTSTKSNVHDMGSQGGQYSDVRTPATANAQYLAQPLLNTGHSFSNQNFSLKDSHELLRFPNEQHQRAGKGGLKASRTQRLVQKSVDGKESSKVANADSISSSREQLLWAQAQNVYASNNFTQVVRTTAGSSREDNKNLSSSKTQRQADDTVQRQQRFRVSTESHVSGISGILANTQLTAMSGTSASQQNSGIKRQPHAQAVGDGGDRLSDDILIGCTTIKQSRQANQQDSVEEEECQKLENFDAKRGSQTSLTSGSLQQRSVDPGPKHLLSSGSIKNNQSTFSNQMQLVTTPSKVYNSIEEAQPILRLCLSNVGSASVSSMTAPSGFTSILLDADVDQNLVCPACKFIVVNPVECQSCQYIICYKCAKELNMQCQNNDPNCNNARFTSQPGRIHKLYRALLNQLEFRCPNQGSGCQSALKYEQVDHHLRVECEYRDRLCPNECGLNKKLSIAALKEHLQTSCPKEKVDCRECSQKIFREDLEKHLAEDCAEMRIKCRHCEQLDTRGAFKRGQHDCISMLKDTITQMRASTVRSRRHSKSATRIRSGDQRSRALDDYQASPSRAYASQQDLDLLMRQVQNLKQDLQNMDHIVTDDIFRMFDNMSLCVTQKDEEVKDLTKKVKKLEEANDGLQAKFCAQASDYEGLFAALNYKLEEKFQDLKKNQEAEIRNMKRMLLKQSQSDMPLQMQPKQERIVPDQGLQVLETVKHVSIRGPGPCSQQRVPPINFNENEQALVARGKNPASVVHVEQQAVQDIDQDDISHIVSQGAVLREQQKHLPTEVIEEEDFVPFLSSTDNELTDLNTEFNTDRPGGAESSAPQSTYRSRPRLSSKISTRNNLVVGAQRSEKNAHSAAGDSASLQSHSQAMVKQSRGSLQPPGPQSDLTRAPPHSKQMGQSKPQAAAQPDKRHESGGPLEGKRKSEGGSRAADMSFDNESVQNERGNKSDQSRGEVSGEESNRSFANNDDFGEAQQQEERNKEAKGMERRQERSEAQLGDGPGREDKEPDQKRQERRRNVAETVGVPSSARLGNQSDAFGSILDESSDIEQIQNNQLPGSIHGGTNTSAGSGFNSHLQSLHSQRSQGASAVSPSHGQFSALSRGQLFGQGKDLGAANGQSPPQSRDLNSEYSIGLANGLGLTTDREDTERDCDQRLPLGTLDSHRQLNSNREHLKTLENLDTNQVNLDKDAPSKSKLQSDVDEKQAWAQSKQEGEGDVGLAASANSLEGNVGSASEDERQRSLRKLLVNQTNFQDEEVLAQVDSQVFQDLEMLIKSDNLSTEQRRSLEEQIWKFNQSQRAKKESNRHFGEEPKLDGQDVENERARGVSQEQERRPGDSEALPSDFEEPQTDLEGNETENEVIRDHLDQLQAIGGQGGGIASALKGLESDLETIFETDLESNYVTTSRTNLSTKKLLSQVHNMAQIQQLNTQLSNSRSQERLSRILLSQCSPIAHAGSASHYSGSNFKRGSSNKKDGLLHPPQGGSAKMTNLSSTNSKRKQELEDTMSPGANGTDTSQSMLVSNRSNPVQQVKTSQNMAHPGRHQSPNLSARQHGKPPVAAQAQCFLTSEQLGKLTQQAQQTQQDRDEHRIRVYTATTKSHSSRNLLPANRAEISRTVPADQVVVNRFQEIKEESVEDEPEAAIEACLLGRGSTADKVKEIRQGLRDKFQHDSHEPRMLLHPDQNQDAMLQEIAQDEHNQDSFCNEEAGTDNEHLQVLPQRDSSFDNGDDDLGTSCERNEAEDAFQFK